MIAELFVDRRSGLCTLVIGEWTYDGNWRYVESVMPEGRCADWAEQFWDEAFVALQKRKME